MIDKVYDPASLIIERLDRIEMMIKDLWMNGPLKKSKNIRDYTVGGADEQSEEGHSFGANAPGNVKLPVKANENKKEGAL